MVQQRSLGSVTARAATAALVANAASVAFSPASREIQYQANYASSNLVADPGQLCQAYYAGYIDQAELYELLGCHGIHWTGDPTASANRKAWNAIIYQAKPMFGPELALQWWRQRRVRHQYVREELRHAGFGDDDQVDLFLDQFENLDLSVLLALRDRGLIDERELRLRLEYLGFTRPQDLDLLVNMRQALTIGDTLQAWNRGLIEPAEADEQLRRNGFQEPLLRNAIGRMRKNIPGPSDLERFAVREVWDQGTVDRFGYDQEYPPEFDYWMEAQGFGRPDLTLDPRGRAVNALEWGKAYWRAHWQMVSPSQAYEMYHRFRGDPNNPASWSVPGIRPFLLEDVRSVLKINDYPPAVRDRLAALSHAVLRLIDIRQAIRLKVRPRAWAVGKYMDRGFTEQDAQFQVDLAEQARDYSLSAAGRARDRSNTEKVYKYTLSLYSLGTLSEEAARQNLSHLLLSEESITLALSTQNIQDQEKVIRRAVRAIQRGFMAGIVDTQEAMRRLVGMGISQDRAVRHINNWLLEMTDQRKAATTAQILRWAKEGILRIDLAAARLRNIGWSQPDVLLQLAEVEGAVRQSRQKADVAAEATLRQRSKSLANAAKSLDAERRRIQREITRITPIATLKKWLKRGIIGADGFRDRMRAGGWDDETIDNYVQEVGEPEPDATNGEGSEPEPAADGAE